jgi:hypothetical protein
MTRLALALATALLAGCSTDPTRGYSSKTTFDPQIRTVEVPVFENQTFYPGLERDLADALVKEIQRQTPMAVVQPHFGGGTRAQTQLTGSIRTADKRALSTSSRTGLVQESALELVIDFEWRDQRTGGTIESVKDLKAIESYVPARPLSGPTLGGERIDIAQKQLAQELARKIVAKMRADW